ncbi:MAG: hypothetical protein F4X94_02870, partial [Dehalococcoidia bacterium]|nr:hypothetical protein [Dehalococcoidia bacterium]
MSVAEHRHTDGSTDSHAYTHSDSKRFDRHANPYSDNRRFNRHADADGRIGAHSTSHFNVYPRKKKHADADTVVIALPHQLPAPLYERLLDLACTFSPWFSIPVRPMHAHTWPDVDANALPHQLPAPLYERLLDLA